MLDANGTRHHLILGAADWKQCHCAFRSDLSDADWTPLAGHSASAVEWYADGQVARLRALPFSFPTPKLDDLPDIERQRRGAAADQFGNWYWIDSSSQRVRVWFEGTTAMDFWPTAASEQAPARGGFVPVETATSPQRLELAGITVSSEHFLIVGTLAPAGVLIFDLAAGGEPMHLLWPSGVSFQPFDMAAGPSGCVWILDRAHGRCWVLDRSFSVVSFAPSNTAAVTTSSPGAFVPGKVGSASVPPTSRVLDDHSAIDLSDALDPISIEVLRDGTLLVLDRCTSPEASRILIYREGEPLKLHTSEGELEALILRVSVSGSAGEKADDLSLSAYDFAVVPQGVDALPVAISVVQQDGNQAYVFDLAQDTQGLWSFASQPGYRPMRRYGGRGLVTLKNLPYYDFAETWVPLIEEARPRYEVQGVLRTKTFDGKEPDCVWHRLMLDACVPSETSLRVWTRWSNDQELLGHAEWMEEPTPYLRRDGSEIPYLCTSGRQGFGEGTWELLFQNARGRYLQIMIELKGNQRATPSLRALRAYYPRFSYLNEYMPALYREDNQSAHFLEGFLANIEGFYTAIEDRIATSQALFDQRTAPNDALEWLAGWFGAALDPSWDEYRRRLFIRHAMLLFGYRGTAHGLRLALAMALETQPEEALFVAPGTVDERRFGVRIIEKYLARRLPDVLLGDPSQLQASSWLNSTAPWKPADGGAALSARYAQALGFDELAAHGIELPLVQPDDPKQPDLAAKWALFTELNLGFTPFAAALERAAWQAAVEAEYIGITACNEKWRSTYASFAEITQPTDMPPVGELCELWISHMRDTNPVRTPLERLQWQSFLRSRYGAVSALNEKYNKNWTDYDLVPFPDCLPTDGCALQDWLQFEGGVLAIRNAAHRFSVLLPMPTGPNMDPEKPHRQLELARRIIELEKPAHTTFDVRFYWAMFRIGEARLGMDTRIDEDMREQLIPPMVLGRGYLGASLVAPTALKARRDRSVLGRDTIMH